MKMIVPKVLILLEQCGFKYAEAPVKYFGHGIYMGVK